MLFGLLLYPIALAMCVCACTQMHVFGINRHCCMSTLHHALLNVKRISHMLPQPRKLSLSALLQHIAHLSSL